MMTPVEYVRWYCHEDSFHFNETWNSQQPVFSRCLYSSVLYTPLAFYVVLYVPWRTVSLLCRKRYSRRSNTFSGASCAPRNIISGLHLFFLLALTAISTAQFILMLWQDDWSLASQAPVDILCHSLKITTFTLAAILVCWHRQLSIHTSPSLLLLSLYYLVVSSFHLTLTFTQHAIFSLLERYSILFQFAISICCCIAQSFSSYRSSDYNRLNGSVSADSTDENPIQNASYLSQLTFHWVDKLVVLGWKKEELTYDDLYPLLPQHKANHIFSEFNRVWSKLRCTYLVPRIQPQSSSSDTRIDDSFAFDTCDEQPIIASVDEEPFSARHKYANCFSALIRVYGWYYSVSIIFSLLSEACVLTAPLALRAMLSYLEIGDARIVWHGYLIVVSLFAITFAQSITQNIFNYRVTLLSALSRSAFVSLIYRKALKVSVASRADSTTGEIVNLMSVDADRLISLVSWVDNLWSAPIRIIVSIYFIYQELGLSVFAGVSVVVILIPFTALLSKFMQKFQKQQMEQKDERIKLVNEVLSGIKVIKLYAWEKSFSQIINEIRSSELKKVRGIAYGNAITTFVYISTPMFVALSSFLTYILSDSSHQLDAKKAFVSIAYFNIMRLPLTNLPTLVIRMITARVSIKRLNKFLNMSELKKYVTQFNDEYAMRVSDASFTHGDAVRLDEKKEAKGDQDTTGTSVADETSPPPLPTAEQTDSDPVKQFGLKNINMKIRTGAFVAIVGPVGSGKSSLVSALLGEMEKTQGSVNIAPGNSIAYVTQQAWIQNNTLKNNVLFGQPFDEGKYQKIISACQLVPDLAILPSGDLTEIGEKGINLSGGQKQRLALARACYSDAQMYILDDPLSAVDAHVSKYLFNEILKTEGGLLCEKTRILVTNDITILPKVDYIYVMVDGTITESGTYTQLMTDEGKFCDFVNEFATNGAQSSSLSPEATGSDELHSGREHTANKSQVHSIEKNKSTADLITKEKVNTGNVEWRVYVMFMRNISLILVTIFFIILMQVFDASDNYWLSLWASDGNSTDEHLVATRVAVYGGLGLGQVMSLLISSLIFARGSVICASKMHRGLLDGILRAPMSFFDTTPIGRIVNRFSKDIDLIDESLPDVFHFWLTVVVQSVATFSVIVFVSPALALLILPVSVVYYFIQKFYIPTNSQLRRIESVTRSPLYSNFSETLTGVSTIRAYGAQSRFIADAYTKLDTTQRPAINAIAANRWLSIRLQFIGNCIVTSAAFLALLQRDTLSPALAGLSITYAMTITQILNWLVQLTAMVEANIVSVERVVEFSELEPEAEWECSDEQSRPSASWPSTGAVEFRSYSTRYRENLDFVLKDITLRVEGGEKVGVVGRTGAGKSSIALALFRLIEPAGGTICIDEVDISKIGLHELRQALTIVPQDPVLFSGKLRINLDPFNRYTEEQLWRCLELAHLKDYVSGLDGGLDYAISEGGSNLSVGQRQLVCLARALLKKTKILVLDEATAAVDLQTDSLIQSTIRKEFSQCTILTIAHRINTIMDSDRILVLDRGSVVEFAPPEQLLEDTSSSFYSLTKDAGSF